MPRSPLHVFTGATGLVGSAIILELLRAQPDARILAIVRPGDEGAAARLQTTLQRAARLNGLNDALDRDIETRCEALPGDLHEPRCGVEPSASWSGAQLWHCAAGLQFQDRYRDEVMQTNVEGTRHALDLAQILHAQAFNFISTAYVAGGRSGPIPEAPVAISETLEFNNHYERSKVMAEQLVRDSGLRARILRPSIVIGHSRTLGAITFSGLYGFVRGVFKFRRLMERTQADLMDSLEVRMLADPDGTLDLVPVDFVGQDAVALALADADPGVYHLASFERPSTRSTIETVFATVGLRPPVFADDVSELTWLDRKLDQSVSIYSAYLFGDKRFDRAQTDRWVKHPAGQGHVLPQDEVRRFCDWYLEHDLLPRERRATT